MADNEDGGLSTLTVQIGGGLEAPVRPATPAASITEQYLEILLEGVSVPKPDFWFAICVTALFAAFGMYVSCDIWKTENKVGLIGFGIALVVTLASGVVGLIRRSEARRATERKIYRHLIQRIRTEIEIKKAHAP